MRKVTLDLTMRVILSVNKGVDISELVNELDYTLIDTTTSADVLNTEITDYEIIDSK